MMERDIPAIRWHPKIPQAKLRRLYHNDARGLTDDVLIDDVGISLFLRCESILLVSDRKVGCPHCGKVFATGWHWHKRNDSQVIRCPACLNWQITGRQYLDSFQRDGLSVEGAIEVIRHYVEEYPKANSYRVKVLLIDRLIHGFHWGLKQQEVPHRSAGNNLIEGTHEEVVAFLDKLTYGANSTPETVERKALWRTLAQDMQSLRTRNIKRPRDGD